MDFNDKGILRSLAAVGQTFDARVALYPLDSNAFAAIDGQATGWNR